MGWQKPDCYPAAAVTQIAAKTAHPLERWAGIVLPLLTIGSPRFTYDWCCGGVPAQVTRGGRVERIVVFRCYMHWIAQQLFRRLPEAERTLDMDDLESATRASVGRAGWRLGRARAALMQFATGLQYRCIEGRLCDDYHRVTIASAEDAARLQRRTDTPVTVRPNRIEGPVEPGSARHNGHLNLLFVGTLSYLPNEEAVKEIVSRLTPLLEQRLTVPFTITIAGNDAPQRLRRLLQDQRSIRFLDGPEDMEALYADSDLVLVPLQAGGGTKIKFIEALAHRRPVISTREGVRGTEAQAQEHYLAAETPEAFAEVIARLSRAPAERRRVADAGWQLYRRLYRSAPAGTKEAPTIRASVDRRVHLSS